MKKLIILTAGFLILSCSACFAGESEINIIYPQLNQKINAFSTFFVGNTDSHKEFKINGKIVTVRKNGGFVEKVNLKPGENLFGFELNNKKIKNYTLYSTKKNSGESAKSPAEKTICIDTIAETVKKYAVIRTAPTMTRLTPLPEGTILKITGKAGNEYRFNYGNRSAFIKEEDVKLLGCNEVSAPDQITSLTVSENNGFTVIKIPLKDKVPVEIVENLNNGIDLSVYNAVLNLSNYKISEADSVIEDITVVQPYEGIVKFGIKTKRLYGYSYGYEDNCFVLRLKKMRNNGDNPFKNIIITIDPGHGGEEAGSVGSTGVAEKTVNLKISEYLKDLFVQQGAKVIMTRETDNAVDLGKRVDIAKQNNSDILLSIHNNALPDEADPYSIHGSGTYFYHPHSLPLAKAVQSELLKEIGFRDNGIYNSSFVLTRPSDFPSVLVETGFMIYPDEYEFLITDAGQKAAAKAIFSGVKKYFEEL